MGEAIEKDPIQSLEDQVGDVNENLRRAEALEKMHGKQANEALEKQEKPLRAEKEQLLKRLEEIEEELTEIASLKEGK